jgi:hypothetical protein
MLTQPPAPALRAPSSIARSSLCFACVFEYVYAHGAAHATHACAYTHARTQTISSPRIASSDFAIALPLFFFSEAPAAKAPCKVDILAVVGSTWNMAGWGWSLESLKSKVQEASEKVALGAMPCVCETPARCACAPAGLVFVCSGGRNCIPAQVVGRPVGTVP